MPAKSHSESAGGDPECQGHGDRQGSGWRRDQESRSNRPESRGSLAGDKGAIALALAVKPVPGTKLPLAAQVQRLDGPRPLRMFFEHHIDQEAWTECQ